MRFSATFYSLLTGMAATLVLQGCGSQPPLVNLPAAFHQSLGLAGQASTGDSWMLPEAGHDDLLYVLTADFPQMMVLSYPKGKSVGKINGGFGHDAFGLCVDRQQDVWVAAESDLHKFVLTEYAHGGIHRKDRVFDKAGRGMGCAIDPTSGDLAIVNWYGPATSQGNIAVDSFASRSTTIYQDPKIYQYYAAAYDSAGDLFVVGQDQAYAPKFAELPHGASKFVEFKVHLGTPAARDVFWDGQYVVLAYLGGNALLDRYSISGSKATLHDEIKLSDAYTPVWVEGSRVIGGGEWYLLYWTYPGGVFKKMFQGIHLQDPIAVAVSRGTQARVK
ncbi:MAG TPA: hypothetical protein VGI19_06345 [Candidatus Cybelea sp.]|jgi:hypothetical protein